MKINHFLSGLLRNFSLLFLGVWQPKIKQMQSLEFYLLLHSILGCSFDASAHHERLFSTGKWQFLASFSTFSIRQMLKHHLHFVPSLFLCLAHLMGRAGICMPNSFLWTFFCLLGKSKKITYWTETLFFFSKSFMKPQPVPYTMGAHFQVKSYYMYRHRGWQIPNIFKIVSWHRFFVFGSDFALLTHYV
jgi:hypothetical protein